MDDEEIVLDITKQMSRRLGIESETAHDSSEAVERYGEALREGKPYNAVLLDMTMAGGAGGVETAAALRKIDPAVNAIVMSGYSDHEVMAAPAKFGFVGVIAKPFRFNELEKVLAEILLDSEPKIPEK